MSEFLTELKTKLVDDDTIWELCDPLLYWSEYLQYTIVVPAGFRTDFASVPRVPVAYTLFGDRAHREAVIHDYLFRKDSIPKVSFMDANIVFLEAMTLRGKSPFVRYSMFLGVCLGSIFCFHKKKVKDNI
jgi:hypothetical protein